MDHSDELGTLEVGSIHNFVDAVLRNPTLVNREHLIPVIRLKVHLPLNDTFGDMYGWVSLTGFETCLFGNFICSKLKCCRDQDAIKDLRTLLQRYYWIP